MHTSPDKPFWRTLLASTPVTAVIDSLVDDYRNTPRPPKPSPSYSQPTYPRLYSQSLQSSGKKRKSGTRAWKAAAVLGVVGAGSGLALYLHSLPAPPGTFPSTPIVYPISSPEPTLHRASATSADREMQSKYVDALSKDRRKVESEVNQLLAEYRAKCRFRPDGLLGSLVRPMPHAVANPGRVSFKVRRRG